MTPSGNQVRIETMMRDGRPRDEEVGSNHDTAAAGSKTAARVVVLCLIALLLLTIVAIASGPVGFAGEWR
jgi:hypothetical protein